MIPPSTFQEALRLFFARAIVAAGVATGIAAAALVALLAFGGWPAPLYGQIITILGEALIGAGGVMVLVIIFLGLGGPVKALKAALGKLSVETQGDDE